jgi:DNA-binding NarL/FixJ family response regulator
VGNGRKRVAICSGNQALTSALRLLLEEYLVQVSRRPADLDDQPDVLVWVLNGAVDVEDIQEVAATVPTLVLAEQGKLLTAVDAGARGFLPETASLDEIRDTVETILNGGAVVPPDLLGTLLRHLVSRRRQGEGSDRLLGELTGREREVFDLASEGATRDEIAEALFISPATARTHLQRVYRKLGVHSQSELMALAMRTRTTEDTPDDS